MTYLRRKPRRLNVSMLDKDDGGWKITGDRPLTMGERAYISQENKSNKAQTAPYSDVQLFKLRGR